MYAWYEILGLCLVGGTLCFIVFRGLDMLLEHWLEGRLDRDLRGLNKTAETAQAAAHALRRTAETLPPLPRRVPGQSLEGPGTDGA